MPPTPSTREYLLNRVAYAMKDGTSSVLTTRCLVEVGFGPFSLLASLESPEGTPLFSQTSEYALRAVVWLADHLGEGPASHLRIAEDAQVPPTYLAKVLQSLKKAGIVSSKRGIGGGYVLNRAADELTVLDVVNAVDPIQRIHGCPLKLASHATKLCGMHARLDRAMALVQESLRNSTVADILGEPARPRPMVDSFPSESKNDPQ